MRILLGLVPLLLVLSFPVSTQACINDGDSPGYEGRVQKVYSFFGLNEPDDMGAAIAAIGLVGAAIAVSTVVLVSRRGKSAKNQDVLPPV